MPKIVDEAEQRRRIRQAARRVFAQRGLVGTGLTHVAAAAGMRRPNLYHYYADKDALINDLAEELLAEEEALFASAVEGDGSPLQRILGLAEAVTGLFDHAGDTGRLILQLWANEPRRVQQTLRRIRERLAVVIREGQRWEEIDVALSPEATAAMIVGLIDGMLLQAFFDRSVLPSERAFRRALCDGVRRILAAGEARGPV